MTDRSAEVWGRFWADMAAVFGPVQEEEMDAKRYQFRVVGTSIRSPVRHDFHTAAMDAVAADFADWRQDGTLNCRHGGVVDEIDDPSRHAGPFGFGR